MPSDCTHELFRAILRAVSRLRTIVVLVLLTGCFDDPAPQVGGDTVAGDTTMTTGGDTPDPIAVCRACQADSCVEYEQACQGAAGCQSCIEAPFTLQCLADALFLPLGACSCNRCEEECGYMCPGELGECRTCTIDTDCNTQTSACLGEAGCAPCLEDVYAAGCQDNAVFAELQACWCLECGPECVWQCEGAGTLCADCLLDPCEQVFSTCLGDATCTACFANPSGAECADDPLLAELAACSCSMCFEPCGPVFDCG